MKLSKLIEELQRISRDHGDVEVIVPVYVGSGHSAVQEVTYTPLRRQAKYNRDTRQFDESRGFDEFPAHVSIDSDTA